MRYIKFVSASTKSRQMPTLYNTGKVQIGICYIAPPIPVNTIDELRLQSALLEPHTVTRKSFFERVLGKIYAWF